MTITIRKILLTALFCCTFLASRAQGEIFYTVRFPNAIHHEAEITMKVSAVLPGGFTFRMGRSSPGRYATHEFGKNVYNVKAFDANGKALKINQLQGDVFQAPYPGKEVTVSYTLYGNWMDGTYAGFDRNYAHMNAPATFMFPVGYDKRARIIQLDYADKPFWKPATQLKPLGNNKFYARDLGYFMDSPIELADFKSSKWEVTDVSGLKQTIHHIAIAPDAQPVIDKFAVMLQKMVQEHLAVWEVFPKFDYGNYYFLHSVNTENAGDGMEHRNSTVIVDRDAKIEGNELEQLGTFSHEFFHAWNVERLRPKSLEPFNFTHSNLSNELWMAEGFTRYYGNLLLKRAGFRTLEECTQTLSELVNAALNTPGASQYSPVESSRYAVFADAGVAIDQTNRLNMFTSYYTYGAAIALALELELRSEHRLTLDDYMRALWKGFGKPEIPYSLEDLEKTLGALTKNPAFATNFFKRYIYGSEKADYATLLNNAGLVLRKARPTRAFSGIGKLTIANDKAIMAPTVKGTPAYNAGLNVGHVLLKIDGETIKTQNDLDRLTGTHKPGDRVQITYVHRGISYNTELTFIEDPSLEVITMEKAGKTPTTEMIRFRDKWLNTQIK